MTLIKRAAVKDSSRKSREPKRARRSSKDGRGRAGSETQIVSAIFKALSMHRKVARVSRRNSGSMVGEYGGKKRFIKFARHAWSQKLIDQCSTAGLIERRSTEIKELIDYALEPDIDGLLHDGRPFAIEVKRPGFPDDERYRRQRAWLLMVKLSGGVSGVATNVDEALAIIS